MYPHACDSIAWLALVLAVFVSTVSGKAVFAHYSDGEYSRQEPFSPLTPQQVGTVDSSTNHAATDINEAIGTGFDAFALNVGQPTQDWAKNTTAQLFDKASGKTFGLFFSFDLSSSSDIDAFTFLYNTYKSHPNYYKLDGKPLISTFGGAHNGPAFFEQLKSNTGAYLIPNPDGFTGDANYYNNPITFFDQWSGALDGVFSWETAWPSASNVPVNTSVQQDVYVQSRANLVGKAYMIGLSSLQYKHCCGATPYYRVGEINLPQRMDEILSMEKQPDYTEVITWNDGGESHYIGPVWPEGVGADILAYGNSNTHPHDGWQNLIGSFIQAYKKGLPASGMEPYGEKTIAGAMWYRGVLKSCPGEQPQGAGAALDAINYAVVLRQGCEGYTIKISTNGQEMARDAAKPGLNYRAAKGMKTGKQVVEVLDKEGNIVASASSAIDVIEGPDRDFCNFNYYVVEI